MFYAKLCSGGYSRLNAQEGSIQSWVWNLGLGSDPVFEFLPGTVCRIVDGMYWGLPAGAHCAEILPPNVVLLGLETAQAALALLCSGGLHEGCTLVSSEQLVLGIKPELSAPTACMFTLHAIAFQFYEVKQQISNWHKKYS